MECYHLLKFGGHRYCSSTDKMFLVCHIIKWVRWLQQCKAIKLSLRPAKFSGQRQYGSEDIMILIFHVNSQDHVIKVTYDFIGRSLSRYVTILLSLVAIDFLAVDI